MKGSQFSWELYHEAPVIGIMRGYGEEDTYRIAEIYESAGLYTLEVTLNTPGALKIVAELARRYPKMNIGMGTVCTMEDCYKAINAGAQFIVTPIVDENVITMASNLSIPIMVGAYSPTEIYRAWSAGATAVKVFPASQLGVKYIKDILGPLDTIKLVPTGGVSLDNAKEFLDAGVFGLGMGGSLFNSQLIEARDFEGLRNHFDKMKGILRA